VDEREVMVKHGITWASMEVKGNAMGKTTGGFRKSCKNNILVIYPKAGAEEFDSPKYS
jgi:hypothetical protein